VPKLLEKLMSAVRVRARASQAMCRVVIVFGAIAFTLVPTPAAWAQG
jgi:hypothetical protein